MTSILNVDTIAAKDGTSPVALTKQIATKSYVVYDFSDDGTPDSFNISSVTDRATGSLFGNVTNNLSQAAYAVFAGVSPAQEGSMTTSNGNRYVICSSDNTSRYCSNGLQVASATTASDDPYTSVSAVGDLA